MIRPKLIADGLTAARFPLGLALFWLGLRESKDTLPLAASFLLTAWVTDVLDGYLARRDKQHTITWLGEHDLTADLVVASGVWAYLGMTGFISSPYALGYAFFAALAFWITRSVYAGWGIQVIPYTVLIWTALKGAPVIGWTMVIWLVLIVSITWPRLPHMADEFIQGLSNVFRKTNL